jgi:hypothetical protein
MTWRRRLALGLCVCTRGNGEVTLLGAGNSRQGYHDASRAEAKKQGQRGRIRAWTRGDRRAWKLANEESARGETCGE